MTKLETFSNDFEVGLQCIPLSAIQFVTALMVVASILLNGFLLRFSWKEFRRSTYSSCLVFMSINNLVASCVSLPLYYMEFFTNNVVKSIPLQLANALCLTRLVSLFTCLAVGLCTLNIICWDRYEALTRLGQTRRITPVIASRIIVAVTLTVASFLVLTRISNLKYMAEGNLTCYSRKAEQSLQTSSIPIMILVGVLITSSKAIAIFTFSSIARQIRQHIAEVRQALGDQNAVKELNLVKVSVVIFMAFTVSWLPFGIARGLMNAIPNRSISCFYFVSCLGAYSLFSFLPLLCICTDKKMKSRIRKVFLRNRLAPTLAPLASNGQVVPTQVTSNF